jgi:hypothetical protein
LAVKGSGLKGPAVEKLELTAGEETTKGGVGDTVAFCPALAAGDGDVFGAVTAGIAQCPAWFVTWIWDVGGVSLDPPDPGSGVIGDGRAGNEAFAVEGEECLVQGGAFGAELISEIIE